MSDSFTRAVTSAVPAAGGDSAAAPALPAGTRYLCFIWATVELKVRGLGAQRQGWWREPDPNWVPAGPPWPPPQACTDALEALLSLVATVNAGNPATPSVVVVVARELGAMGDWLSARPQWVDSTLLLDHSSPATTEVRCVRRPVLLLRVTPRCGR